MNILFVEDNPGDALLMKEVFRKLSLNHEIHILEDGTEVFPYLKKEGDYANAVCPDLVLLDLNMPKKGGIEILMEIKKDEDLSRIPVIVFTSSQSPKDVEDAYRHCANAVVTKPLDLKGLKEMVTALNSFWFEKAILPKRKNEENESA